ncbi:FapA family protein [Spirochaetota bacterium]
MSKLKDLLLEIDNGGMGDRAGLDEDSVEVFADSVKQALSLASEDLGVDISKLDYEILEKGTRGFFGMGRQPYKVLVMPSDVNAEYDNLDEVERKLSKEHTPTVTMGDQKNVDGSFKVRVTKSGIWLTIIPRVGRGKNVQSIDVNNKLYSMKITEPNNAKVDKEVKSPSGKPVKIGDWSPNPDYDSTINIELTEDEMHAYVHFVPPRFFGRHLEYDEIIESLRGSRILTGLKEDEIKKYLEEMDYSHPLLAAEGTRARNGNNAFIDYKVKIDKTDINFEEDESGKVDFRNLELLENVVVGQLLAVKVPAEEGVPGRTVTNKVLPAKQGKDSPMRYGKGTILSEDGTELTAEINGQVVFKAGRISVEPVYVVNGDVSLETGNIVFLGSVIISGNVQDNFVVKAAGNIEVKGTVQKAFLEAEGDIIIYQGISGREDAKIESTGGSIYAKFVQNTNLIAEKDVVIPEGVLHSNVDAGDKIYCTGRRARIVGGLIRAGREVNARFIGGSAETKTELRVGINPKILQQLSELDNVKEKNEKELEEVSKNLKTLTGQRKSSGGKLPKEKEKMFSELTSRNKKMVGRIEEIDSELSELNEYISMLEHKGKVCAEKSIYPGVDIYIKDQKFFVKDEYKHVKFTLEGSEIKVSEYDPPEISEGRRLMTLSRRR